MAVLNNSWTCDCDGDENVKTGNEMICYKCGATPYTFTEKMKLQAMEFTLNPPRPVPDYHIELLPVDKDELKLIKIGLFEVSEYLDSPKLRELMQRVNAISNSIKPKLPAESIFNKGPFAQAAAEFREAAAYMKSPALSKEPK